MSTKRKLNIRPVIIDTDPGHDDALAILLLEKCGVVDVQAITTVAGNSYVQDTTNNARYILDLIGGTTPLFSGAAKPLRRPLVKAVVHGKGGMAGARITKQVQLTGDAPQQITSIVRRNPGKVSIVAIGPETNLAQAFLRDPGLPRLIKQIVIMGGAITVPGNKNRVAEFNVFVDPEAARIVFDAPVRKVLVPLDACNDIVLQLSDFEKLRGSRLYGPILRMMRKYVSGIRGQEKVTGALMYDPLAAYYLVNPAAYTLVPMDVRVETKGELTRGMTVAERWTWGNRRENVEVAVAIDRKAFVSDFLRILKK
jgi:inosine-uridine nucleoside N-ribohydrolase